MTEGPPVPNPCPPAVEHSQPVRTRGSSVVVGRCAHDVTPLRRNGPQRTARGSRFLAIPQGAHGPPTVSGARISSQRSRRKTPSVLYLWNRVQGGTVWTETELWTESGVWTETGLWTEADLWNEADLWTEIDLWTETNTVEWNRSLNWGLFLDWDCLSTEIDLSVLADWVQSLDRDRSLDSDRSLDWD